MNHRATSSTCRAVPSLSRQTPSPRPLSPLSMTLFKPAPLMAWKTGGLFDEDVLPAEMQDADIGQMFSSQQQDDVGTILSMIGVAGHHQASGGTVDWSQVAYSKHWADESIEEDNKFTAVVDVGKKKRPNVTCFKLPIAMAEVKNSRPASPCPISNLDLPADLLQRLIAESGVFDDGIGNLPTPPPVLENPLGLLSSPFPTASDHAMYVKKRRLSSTGSCDDNGSTVFSAVSNANESVHDEKYLERRRKNNIASRRSRELRKRKMETMEARAEELERENKTLRARVEELERTTRLMKELLLQRLSLPHQGLAGSSAGGHQT